MKKWRGAGAGFVLVVALIVTAALAPWKVLAQPAAAQNRYCGAHIYAPGNYPACQYLLQSGFANGPSNTKNAVVYHIYKIPATPETTNAAQDFLQPAGQSYVPLDGVSVNDLFTPGITPDRFPDRVILSFPYCANTAFEFIEVLDNLEVEEWNAAGTARVNTTVLPTPPECRGEFLFNYEPVCGARNSITFDTHCGPDASVSSFSDCVNLQAQVSPVVLPATVSFIGNVSQAIVPAAYDLLNTASFTSSIARCENLGTRVWQQTYNGAFPNTRNRGIATLDRGAPAGLAGTVTFKIPAACSTLPISRFAIKATGLFRANNAASPVSIVYSNTTFAAQRTAYATSASCETEVPRPTGSQPTTPIISLQPYCRVTTNVTTASGFPYIAAVFGSNLLLPPAQLPANGIVFSLTVAGVPSPETGSWVRVRFTDPVNASLTETFGPYILKNGYQLFFFSTRDLNSQPGSRVIEIQKSSPLNDWQLAFYETEITTAPYCNCNETETSWSIAGLLPCRAAGDRTVINETLIPFNPWTGSVQTVSGVLPVCDVKLVDGYLGSVDSVLWSGIYTALAKVNTGNSFLWSFSNSVPRATSFLNATTGLAVRFSVSTKTDNLLLNFTVANTTVVPPFTSTCGLKIRVFEGAPVAVLIYSAATAQLGGNPIILNGSLSVSTTDEPLTWSWYISYPEPSAILPGTLSSTGNESVISFVPLQTGLYVINMRVSIPRVFRELQARIQVTNTTVPTNTTNTPSVCVSTISNGNISDPNIPPYDNSSIYFPESPQVDPIIWPPASAPAGENPPNELYLILIILYSILVGLLLVLAIYYCGRPCVYFSRRVFHI